jgi:hypothetical protein
MSTADVQRLSELMEGLHNEFRTIQKTQTDILYVIQGNPIDKTDSGLLGIVNSLEKDVTELKEDKKKRNWTIGVAVTVGGILVSFIQFYFLKIHK